MERVTSCCLCEQSPTCCVEIDRLRSELAAKDSRNEEHRGLIRDLTTVLEKRNIDNEALRKELADLRARATEYERQAVEAEQRATTYLTELSTKDGNRPLPHGRDRLGRLVREAWVRWAYTQPNPKPSWLKDYDELAEPDKEADRQIGECIARWTLIGDAARECHEMDALRKQLAEFGAGEDTTTMTRKSFAEVLQALADVRAGSEAKDARIATLESALRAFRRLQRQRDEFERHRYVDRGEPCAMPKDGFTELCS